MYNIKNLSALLCLLLAVGPTAVISAPIAEVESLAKRQATHSNTDAASFMGAGIPDGPNFNKGDFSSTGSDEDCDEDEGDNGNGSHSGSSSSSNTDAGDFATFGIPDGPSATFGNFYHHDYEETHSEQPVPAPPKPPVETPISTPPAPPAPAPPAPAPPAPAPPAPEPAPPASAPPAPAPPAPEPAPPADHDCTCS